jgi:hypothetical protein
MPTAKRFHETHVRSTAFLNKPYTKFHENPSYGGRTGHHIQLTLFYFVKKRLIMSQLNSSSPNLESGFVQHVPQKERFAEMSLNRKHNENKFATSSAQCNSCLSHVRVSNTRPVRAYTAQTPRLNTVQVFLLHYQHSSPLTHSKFTIHRKFSIFTLVYLTTTYRPLRHTSYAL